MIICLHHSPLTLHVTFDSGDLVAIHRKVHLFDIDIPGKIRFKVGNIYRYTKFGFDLMLLNVGKRDIDGWYNPELL